MNPKETPMTKLTLALIAVGSLAVAHSASATEYKGKCAKQAEDAAVKKWADVPNPDPNLEYITVSSRAAATRSDKYEVILALNDGNESAYAKYEVTFENLGSCKGASVEAK